VSQVTYQGLTKATQALYLSRPRLLAKIYYILVNF